MNYDDLSDFDINQLVSEALGHELMPDDYYTSVFNANYPNSVWSIKPDQLHEEHNDYCNNPSDAWLIIVENKIETRWSFDDNWAARITNQGQAGEFKMFESWHKNPLRAAMIVFLRMKEPS